MITFTRHLKRFSPVSIGSLSGGIMIIATITVTAIFIMNQLTPAPPPPKKVPFPSAKGSLAVPILKPNSRVRAAWYTFGIVVKHCSLDILSEERDLRFRWEYWNQKNTHGTSLTGECTFENVSDAIDKIIEYIFGDTPEGQAIRQAFKKQLADSFAPH